MTGTNVRSGVSIAVSFAIIAIAIAVAFSTLTFGHTAHHYLANGIANFLLGGAVALVFYLVVS